MFRQWQQWLGQRFRLESRRPTRRPGRAFLPFRLEQLEDRTLLSTFVVVNINDSGPGSLRDAITQANLDTSATSVIDFNIQQIVSPPATVNTITLRSALPTITHPVQLDGTSQPGYAGIPLVELDGSAVQTAASGLTIAAGASTVKGLAIHGFRAHGIVLENLGQDVIAADFLGTDASGRTSVPNSGFDIDIEGVSGNTIGGKTSGAGNVISGGGLGIFINGGSGDVIQGNLIGTDLSGEHALNARGSGIELINGASGVLIGGTTTSAQTSSPATAATASTSPPLVRRQRPRRWDPHRGQLHRSRCHRPQRPAQQSGRCHRGRFHGERCRRRGRRNGPGQAGDSSRRQRHLRQPRRRRPHNRQLFGQPRPGQPDRPHGFRGTKPCPTATSAWNSPELWTTPSAGAPPARGTKSPATTWAASESIRNLYSGSTRSRFSSP